MYEDLAWKNFENTGSIESFLEYKKLKEIYNLKSISNMESSEESKE